jgi:glucose uptake protein GlcU
MYLVYTMLGSFTIDWLLLLLLPFNRDFSSNSSKAFHLSVVGILGGLMWTSALIAGHCSTVYLHNEVSQSVISSTAVVISYTSGKLILGESSNLPALSISGLVVLITALIGISLSSTIAQCIWLWPNKIDRPIFSHSHALDEETKAEPALDQGYLQQELLRRQIAVEELTFPRRLLSIHSRGQGKEQEWLDVASGIACALTAGVILGSFWLSLILSPSDQRGINFLSGLSVGLIALTPIAVIVENKISAMELKPFSCWSTAMKWGLLSGLLWGLGQFFTVGALDTLPFSTTVPVLQSSLWLHTFFGIRFCSIRDNVDGVRVVFAGCTVLLVLGSTMLIIAD